MKTSLRDRSKCASLGERKRTGGVAYNTREESGGARGRAVWRMHQSSYLHSGSQKASSDVGEPIGILRISRGECTTSLDYPPYGPEILISSRKCACNAASGDWLLIGTTRPARSQNHFQGAMEHLTYCLVEASHLESARPQEWRRTSIY